MGAMRIFNKAIATAAEEQETTNPLKDPQTPCASHVCQHLQCIYKIATPIITAKNDDADNNNDSDSTCSSGWDSNDDEEYNHL